MSNRFSKKCVAGVFVFLFLFCLPMSALADRPELVSRKITGAAPSINGVVGAGEWPGPPQLVFDGDTEPSPPFTYIDPTFVYFCNDLTHIYVLVDAVGDKTQDGGDECLLIFANGEDYILTEGFGDGSMCPDGIQYASGFGSSPNDASSHRIHEFRIPLSEINAIPGQILDFCSPHNSKYMCLRPTGSPGGSLGYDETTGNDNIWPPGLNEVHDMREESRGEWGLLQLQPTQNQNVPTLSEWGMILMGLILAGAAMWAMKRKQSAAV
ncbi:MAG: IPTL-CTERM sorting domain-containing protein [Desulfobacterales bacterium]|nr:IPTL-CTERM sorting domain-containing protein [Desulfobacterales bacterium]